METNSNDHLEHHGILGMKWGVRKELPSEYSSSYSKKIKKDDTIISPGKQLDHVSSKKRLKLNNDVTYTYDPKNVHDKQVYQGPYSIYLRGHSNSYGPASIYNHSYTTTDYLRMPSKQTRVNQFKDDYSKNVKTYGEQLNNMQNVLGLYNGGDYKYVLNKVPTMKQTDSGIKRYNYRDYTDPKILKDKKATADAYTLFQAGNVRNGYTEKIGKDFVDSISKKGYNAIPDDNNLKIYNDASTPLIVLNGKTTLNELNRAKKISYSEVRENANDVDNYMKENYNRRVAY